VCRGVRGVTFEGREKIIAYGFSRKQIDFKVMRN